MEHRTNERVEVDLLAHVVRGGRTLGLFRVKDIGNGGMGLVDESEELCLYDFVSITLKSPADKKQAPPLYALIVQNGYQCAGAMWAVGQVDVPHLVKPLVPVAA